MSKKQIEERIALLYLALQYCSQKTKTFTAGESINQERFQWMHILDHTTALSRPVSKDIDNKLQEVAKRANQNNFKPSYGDPFKEEITIG